MLSQRKYTQLNTCREATRIGNVTGRTNRPAVQFRQAIDEIVLLALDAVIHRKVDNLDLFRDNVRFHKLPRVAMRRTEEKAIDFIQRELSRKAHVRLAIQAFVDVRNPVSRIAGAIDKDYCTLMKPLASSAVQPFCISPYSPNFVFTKSSCDSTPTVEKESGRSSRMAVPFTLRCDS